MSRRTSTSSGRSSHSLLTGSPLVSGSPPLPPVASPRQGAGRRPRRAVPPGDLRGGPRPRLRLGDDPRLLLDGVGFSPWVGAPVLALAGGELVDPIAEVLPAGGMAHPAHGPGEAPSVREAVVHGGPPHLQGELGLPLPLRGPDLPVPQIVLVPGPGRMPRRVAELGNGVCRAQVELDVGLDCQLALLRAVHAVLRVTFSWSRITTAVPCVVKLARPNKVLVGYPSSANVSA